MKYSDLFLTLPLVLSTGVFAQSRDLNSIVPSKDNNFGVGEKVSVGGAGTFTISGHSLMYDGYYESDRRLPSQDNPCFSFVGRKNYTYSRFLTPESFQKRNLRPVYDIKGEIVCVTGSDQPKNKKFELLSGTKGQPIGALFFDQANQSYSYFDIAQKKEVLAWRLLTSKDSGGTEIWLDVQNGIAWGPKLSHKVTRHQAINGAQFFSTNEFPAGSWEMPTVRPEVRDPRFTQYMGSHTRSYYVGLNQVLPDMEPAAPENWRGSHGDRLIHWVMVESAEKNQNGTVSFKEDSDQIATAQGVTADGTGATVSSGFLAFVGISDRLEYVRYVLKPSVLKEFLLRSGASN